LSRGQATALGLALAVALVAGVVVAGHLPRGHPLVPALDFGLPGLRAHLHLETASADFGSIYTIDGTTPHHDDGAVRVEGRWNGGPWLELVNGRTHDGSYLLQFPIEKHGNLSLRVHYPGGEADGTVLVP